MATTDENLAEKLHERLSEGDTYAEKLAEAVRSWESLDESPHGLVDPNDTVLLSDAPTAASIPWPTRPTSSFPPTDYATLCDQLPDALALIDQNNCVKLWNAAAAELFGWSRVEVLGRPAPFACGAHEAEHLEILTLARNDSPIRERIVSRRGKDGKAMLLTLMTRNMPNAEVLLVFRKLAEQAPGAARGNLPASRLEALGRMVAGVSHDFNNVLAAIVGSADLLADRINIHHPDREWVEVIRAAGRHATGLTKRLIEFAKPCPTAGQAADAAAVLNELIPLLKALLPNGVRLKMQTQAGLPRVNLDATSLEQIAINLALNAGQAMPRGGALQIRLSLEQRDNREFLMLAVADSGSGIDPALQPQLFHPFFSTRTNGTGLGLAMVRDLAQQAGGFVELDSILGLGTVFRVLLPPVQEPQGTFDGTGLTALVVDDDPAIGEVVKHTLESVGMNVSVTEDGEEALQATQWSAVTLDLLITDVVMPGLGGRKLAERLRSQRPNLPVLYISSYPRVHEPLPAEMRFLAKPFSPRQLLDAVALLVKVNVNSP